MAARPSDHVHVPGTVACPGSRAWRRSPTDELQQNTLTLGDTVDFVCRNHSIARFSCNSPIVIPIGSYRISTTYSSGYQATTHSDIFQHFFIISVKFLTCVRRLTHVIAIGWTSVRLSVRYTLVLSQYGSTYRQTVFTAWQPHDSSFTRTKHFQEF